jgi:hypothetical protein
MSCKEIDAYLAGDPNRELPLNLRDHVQQCSSCQALLKSLRTVPPVTESMVPKPGFTAGILADLQPVRPLPGTAYLVLTCLVAALLVLSAGISMWGTRGWAAQTPAIRLFLFGAILAGVAGSAYGLALQMIPGSRRRIPISLPVVGALAIFAGTVLLTSQPSSGEDLIDWICFRRGLLVAAVALPFLFMVIRKGALFDRFQTAVTLVAALSWISLLVLTMYCPLRTVHHVFLSHMGSTAVVMMAGIVIGKILR